MMPATLQQHFSYLSFIIYLRICFLHDCMEQPHGQHPHSLSITCALLHSLLHSTLLYRGGIVDCQERGLRESDWDDPIDSREEGTQKYATSTAAANARIAALHSATAAKSQVDSGPKKPTKAMTSSASASSLIAKAASDFGTGKSTPKSSGSAGSSGSKVKAAEVDDSVALKKIDDELRKTILNAPRRISKIESSIAKHEVEIKKIDDEMLTVSC